MSSSESTSFDTIVKTVLESLRPTDASLYDECNSFSAKVNQLRIRRVGLSGRPGAR
jgi:hypothetical protein